jgi:selenocysteine lyase/cysteine desulfurase
MPVVMNPVQKSPFFGISLEGEPADTSENKITECSIYIDWDRQRILFKDAVFFSPHKFVGGPSTAGVLIAKKVNLVSSYPSNPGGGTIFFVHSDGAPRYTEKDEDREEGGTPDIVSCVRTGLVLHLQNHGVGYKYILQKEQEMLRTAKQRWNAHPNIYVYASNSHNCLSILSFEILESTSNATLAGRSHRKRLHWNYVATLCNDVFGIQCRGGCLCAGKYSVVAYGDKIPTVSSTVCVCSTICDTFAGYNR